MPTTKRPNGYIIYRGPSLIDGNPIVAIVTGLEDKSTNAKTGAMIQTYILRDDIKPVDALRIGADVSVCGDCPLRGDGTGKNRGCYVNLGQGPRAVFDGFTRGIYPVATNVKALGAGRAVRLGTYGDPAAVPAGVWRDLVSLATSHTGYSHQWRNRPDLRDLVMASADTGADKDRAWAEGWRTFRLADSPAAGEILCPAYSRGINCIDCGLCDGAGSSKSIVIPAHGAGKKYAMQVAA